jgi:hypothetical protein
MDRSSYPVKKTRLHDAPTTLNALSHASPVERVMMVWSITLQAWAFKDPNFHESRLRRDVVRTIRGRGLLEGE